MWSTTTSSSFLWTILLFQKDVLHRSWFETKSSLRNWRKASRSYGRKPCGIFAKLIHPGVSAKQSLPPIAGGQRAIRNVCCYSRRFSLLKSRRLSFSATRPSYSGDSADISREPFGNHGGFFQLRPETSSWITARFPRAEFLTRASNSP